MHLRFDYMTAYIDYNEKRHAIEVMQSFGITYQHFTPQSIADQFWFWNCENVPDNLQEYITELNVEPMECIGFGLSKEDAIKINNYDR